MCRSRCWAFSRPNCGGQLASGFRGSSSIVRLPGVAQFPCEVGVLGCTCPVGGFVLTPGLAVCAVAPVTVCCKFNVNKEIVSNWMKNGCVVMVCGLGSGVWFCVLHREFCLFPRFSVCAVRWKPRSPQQLHSGAALDAGQPASLCWMWPVRLAGQIRLGQGDRGFGGKVLPRRLDAWALAYPWPETKGPTGQCLLPISRTALAAFGFKSSAPTDSFQIFQQSSHSSSIPSMCH